MTLVSTAHHSAILTIASSYSFIRFSSLSFFFTIFFFFCLSACFSFLPGQALPKLTSSP